MKAMGLIVLGLLMITSCQQKRQLQVSSPDGNIQVEILTDSLSSLCYTVYLNNKEVIKPSGLGIELTEQGQAFLHDLKFVGKTDSIVDDEYTAVSGKRKHCAYHANRTEFTFKNADGNKIGLIFQVSNHSVAFRYRLNNHSSCKVDKEISEFGFNKNSLAWIMNYRHLWNDYELYYTKRILDTMNMPAYYIPGLIQTPQKQWVFISDADVNGDYAACQLIHKGEGKLGVRFPDQFDSWDTEDESAWYKVVKAESAEIHVPAKLLTPWRAMIVSENLADIVESDLIKNLGEPSKVDDESWIEPGVATFPWWGNSLANDQPETLKDYIDFAAEMNWKYLEFDIGLIDNGGGYASDHWWEIDYIPEIINYATSKGIKVYGWDERSNLNTPEKRDKIFSQYKKWGIAGIKMDFINSDKQAAMKWYEDATAHAAQYKLLVSFHGAISPRGLQRTYPNIMTYESVRGAEYYKFDWHKDKATPEHHCTLPFTRNISGPMDFTPVSYSSPERTSTYAQETALPFIFESGWVCMADKPEEFRNSPAKGLLKNVHASWDDIKFIDGYPGEYCCIARKKNKEWFVAAINTKSKRQVEVAFHFLPEGKYTATLYSDDCNDGISISEMDITQKTIKTFDLLGNGGFVLYIKH